MLKDSINKSAKECGVNPYVLSQIIQGESNWKTPYENKSKWNKVKLFFRKLFKSNKEIKPCNTLGLGQFSINQANKNNNI
ncbi:hypothetical protein [Clostridium sp.]|uniref:hypothetical protein n=1 Tax=Clostridium sp. TaxID=1506 RepID=UPI001A604712|nr:hypothetical protein [Clostridium sp.]MBK5242127.1 hypothetical protein [Clostridium sp.]